MLRDLDTPVVGAALQVTENHQDYPDPFSVINPVCASVHRQFLLQYLHLKWNMETGFSDEVGHQAKKPVHDRDYILNTGTNCVFPGNARHIVPTLFREGSCNQPWNE